MKKRLMEPQVRVFIGIVWLLVAAYFAHQGGNNVLAFVWSALSIFLFGGVMGVLFERFATALAERKSH